MAARSDDSGNPPLISDQSKAQPGVGTCLVEPETGRLLAIDSQVATWLGVEAEDLGSLSLAEFMPELNGELLDQEIAIAFPNQAEFQAEVSFVRLVGSKENHLLLNIRPLEVQLSETLFCDALTGLPDRRELENQRRRWRARGSGRAFPHAALFLDLDGFKQINDRHGHAMGDRVLVALAKRWQSCIREGDLLARYGGDEFVLLLEGVRSQQELEPIIGRLVDATVKPIEIDELELGVNVTIGVALADDTTTDIAKLLAEADRDMYAKKRDA